MKITKEVLTKAINRKIFAWVDATMKDILPPDIYASAHLGNNTDRLRANKWLAEKGYRIQSFDDGIVQLLQGTKVLRQAKMVIEVSDQEEMLQIAEAVYHKNIPPPPWQR